MIASITPEAWLNDNAIAVDPPGDTEWDCTAAWDQLPEDYRERLLNEMVEWGDGLDVDDVLRGDPAAPAWVRAWSGPFSIRVREGRFDS